ncbi:MAG: hypothetical protein OHK005_04720 [Candidatus Methylacidiphilales bacterium]
MEPPPPPSHAKTRRVAVPFGARATAAPVEADVSGKVLIVDDDILVREMLSLTLMEAGFETVTVPDAEIAGRWLEKMGPSNFDAVVTDYLMPGADGITFGRFLMELEPPLQIILLTTQDDKDVIKESLRTGFFDFLEKPPLAGVVVEAVKKACRETRKRRGRRLERYLIDRSALLGEGGISKVYRATDLELHRTVAVKRLKPFVDLSHATPAGIFHEALTLASLQHPNIVQVFDCGMDDEGAFIVLEYVRGRTLDELASSGQRLPETGLVDVARQCLQGLIAAHALGILHRDIKPGNIMVVEMAGGWLHVKILDFGLAKLAHTPTPQTVDPNGRISGSVYTMAPEQFSGLDIDQRTDLYALGCVLYYTASGEYPFEGDTIAEIIHCHLQGKPKPLGELRPDLSPEFVAWVMRLLERMADRRPRSAVEARQLLEARS